MGEGEKQATKVPAPFVPLTKKRMVNEGEVPQYYVKNSHLAITEPEEFDAVQIEIERRKKLGRPSSCHSPFSARIVCGDCGGLYGSKVWGSNTKYRRTIWRCNEKYKGEKRCKTPHVTEDDLKQRFLNAFNTLMGDREELVANCRLAQSYLCDCSEIDDELAELGQEIEVVTELYLMGIKTRGEGKRKGACPLYPLCRFSVELVSVGTPYMT